MISAVAELYEEELRLAREAMGQIATTKRTGTWVFNEEATRDTIRHYAIGTADFNPLYLDDEYARDSRFGTRVAPWTFPYSVHRPSMSHWLVGLPGDERWGVLNGGCSWTFHRRIKLGDRLHVTCQVADAELKQSKTFQQMIVLTSDVSYWDQDDVLVAHAMAKQIRYLARLASPERTAELQGRSRPSAAVERDLTPPAAGMRAAQTRRGSVPRYWEDVEPDEQLPDQPMGTLGVQDIINWLGGTTAPTPPIRFVRPGEERSEGWHDPESARAKGIPLAYDNGPLRSAWLGQFVANWAGDDGDLRRFQYSLRAFNMVGDVSTLKGNVIGKRLDQGDGLVDLDVWVENDRGVRSAYGGATVTFPRKQK